MDYNPYQQAVIRFRQGAGVCVAAPGSGKTAVIVARIKALLAEGIRPEAILSTTFTSEGAKEMVKRAGLKTKHKLFRTFHSWALEFIKREAAALPFRVHTDYHGQPAPLCLPREAARTLAQIVRRIPSIDWKDAAGIYFADETARPFPG